ncbi:hypothetical protein N7455_008191 [Penicillium solitum]|uniref:uncharacterized protein n=1 Tax=Penicillium solitum TaxID=60172 RepID=UPI0032C49C9C|nr:hypothetical protein N7455_008191 [Penicillium solitum]
MFHKMKQASFAVALGLFTVLSVANPVVPLEEREAVSEINLATKGVGPIAQYRIVALTYLGNNVILASYDGRPDGGDSPSPNSILQRRSTDNGATWSDPTFIAKGQIKSSTALQYGFSDPSYIYDRETGKVFNFHVFSKDQGFRGGVLGNDDTNRNVVSSEVSVSTDKGLTWSTDPSNQPNLPPVVAGTVGAPPLITKAVKPIGSTVNGVANVGGVKAMFAASGEGIQLRYGSKAGRLVQQFTGSVVQSDGSITNQAYSVYSDNGGDTWQMGKPIGKGLDENKVVELSNGTLMINSRPGDGSQHRIITLSNDGGETYGTPRTETQLPDPANNGAITRAYPDAAQGSAEAKVLLFTNANSKSARVNGTVRYSCDDGNTWSSGKVFRAATVSYSTITPIGDGKFGLFFEAANNDLQFVVLTKEWIGISC